MGLWKEGQSFVVAHGDHEPAGDRNADMLVGRNLQIQTQPPCPRFTARRRHRTLDLAGELSHLGGPGGYRKVSIMHQRFSG